MYTLDYSQGIPSELGAFSPPSLVDSSINEEMALVTSLQKSLDVKAVLQEFARYTASLGRLCRVSFRADEDTYNIRLQGKGAVLRTFALEVHNKVFGHLTYVTESPLAHGIVCRLQHLHTLLQYPLHNALQFDRLQRIATRDSLTQLGNRLSFDESFTKSIYKANRGAQSVALMLMDLDNFKAVNDNFGHAEGDAVIRTFAAQINKAIRASDTAFRFGGDEFAIIIEDGEDYAPSIIHQRLTRLLKNDRTLNRYQVTCSIGTAKWMNQESQECLFNRADKALYQAKRDGRACLRIS